MDCLILPPRSLSSALRATAGITLLALLTLPVEAAASQDQGEPPPPPSPAAPPPLSRPVYQIQRVPAQVVVDGQLTESTWDRPPDFTLDYEVYPGESTPAQVRTEGWLAYDDHHLYIAFRAHDPDPKAIRARLTDRDRAFQDDFVGVVLDTFNDERRAYEFFVNPLGVQMDLLQNDVTGSEDSTWDAIWDSAGRLTPGGFEVELAIPFTSLRFPRVEGIQTWGLDAARIHPRDRRRQTALVPRDRNRNCYLCQAAKLRGFDGISPSRDLEFDPTVTGSRTDLREEAGGPLVAGDEEPEVGLTARWGITPNLTLNAALNPDFSQVEADTAQLDVNTQFALFYPEKRPFFLEGADYFATKIQAIYTRNLADPAWGLKLSGKEGPHALGLVVAEDEVTNLLIPGAESSDLTSIPGENLSSIFRYRRDVGATSTMGVLYTGREGESYHNRVFGVDGLFRPNKTEAFRIELLGSQTLYPHSLAQEFGQPSKEFTGHALRAGWSHTTEHFSAFAVYDDRAEEFRADLGFLPEVDLRRLEVVAERTWYAKEGDWWTRAGTGGLGRESQRQNGDPLERRFEAWGWLSGPRQSFLNSGVGALRKAFGGELFDLNYAWFFIEAQPTGSVYFALDSTFGDQIDFENVRPGERLRLQPILRFDLGRHLRLVINHTYEALDVETGRLFTANLSQLSATYQFTARTFVRLISQYLDLQREPERYTFEIEPEARALFNQLLFSYKVNPQTVVFLGYSDSHAGDGQGGLEQDSRTFFVKIGYAWLT